MTRVTSGAVASLGWVVMAASALTSVGSGQVRTTARLDPNDIGGVVASAAGPEAGVWVIAETTDLPTGFRKIVVTDEQGRYLIPALPNAKYSLWVRGYGLVDSPKVSAGLGKTANLTAVLAPTPRVAAQIYPAMYWFSLLRVPSKDQFPGTGDKGNGISKSMRTQAQWINEMKSGCTQCHQLGTQATREVPAALGHFDSSVSAWDRRLQSGQIGQQMSGMLSVFGRQPALTMFSRWSDDVASGVLPPTPARPQGIERNVVISQWDWGDPLTFVHDIAATDRRNPMSNAFGVIYGNSRLNEPNVITLDPKRNVAAASVAVPVRDRDTPFWMPQSVLAPSAYWGSEIIWTGKSNMHNQVLDQNGRVWMTSTIRGATNPAFCGSGSSHPSAREFPLVTSGRQASVYDPKTGKMTLIDLCFGTHHLMLGEDANNTLWFSGGGQVLGWLNTRLFLETGDAEKSQGWSPFILDTNGNGKRDAYVEPDQPMDPSKDKRIGGRGGGAEAGFSLGLYGITTNPIDGTVWGAVVNVPGTLIRFDPKTGLSEAYEPPFDNPNAHVQGFAPRGIDIDANGVLWTGLQSGHLASFDRRKCHVLNGPTATGQHCPEGWTLYKTPGPTLTGVTDWGSADMHYYAWVDRYDTFGLGKSVPFVMGTNSDAIEALAPNGKFVVVRVPYPLGYYSRGVDGRIDDPKAGWKGKGIWAAYSSQAPWHTEGGRGATSKLMHIQLRPDPLAH